MQTNPVVEQN